MVCEIQPEPPPRFTFVVRDVVGAVLTYRNARLVTEVHHDGLVVITVEDYDSKWVDGQLPFGKD